MIGAGRAFALVMSMLAATAAAAGADLDNGGDPHVRSKHSELLAAVSTASQESATFRALVDRLAVSDVVVYLEYERQRLPHVSGHLTFMSAAGGRRYLRVFLDRSMYGPSGLALIGHELQHAVEIAEAPWVNDEASLVVLYARIGFAASHSEPACFDSTRAIEAGRRIQREVAAYEAAAGSR